MAQADEKELFHQLMLYTLEHARSHPEFIHQYVVDAFGAQCAGGGSKPIQVAFALIGLHLHLDRGYDGRQVQLAHMSLARRRRSWPLFAAPGERGSVRVADVADAAPGPDRDRAIERWMACVWSAWHASHAAVRDLVEAELDV